MLFGKNLRSSAFFRGTSQHWQLATFACIYFEDEPTRQRTTKRVSRDAAFLSAINIAKLPSVPRSILKDIPRPPHSASAD
jgi:hypothetical protein